MEAADFLRKKTQPLHINTTSSPTLHNQISSLSERLASQSLQRKTSPQPSAVSEHASTPPISVTPAGNTNPRSEVNNRSEYGNQRREDDKEYSYEREKPSGSRRKSISFAPKVKLDSGQQLPLQQPLSRFRGDRGDKSAETTENAAALQIYGSSPPSKESYSFARPRRRSGFELYDDARSEDGDSRGSRSDYGSPVGSPPNAEDDNIRYEERDRMGSLTSASTASPPLDELKTPPSAMDNYLSTRSASFRSSASLQDEGASSPWPWMTNAQRSKSFSVDKPRRTRAERKASCPTPNSPASQFLRGWKKPKAALPDDEGQAIGDYIIGRTIGFGGFSEVKEAHTLENGKKIVRAVKIVKKKVKDAEAENDAIQAEFEHEINLWRHICHPRILDLISVHDTPYAYFCITRYSIGGTLFDLVKNNRSGVNPKLVQRYIHQLSSALRYLHQDMRIVHRDVKLENVLLNTEEDPEGHILLCDFGMAEFLPSSHNDEDSDEDGYGRHRNRPPMKTVGPAGSSSAIASNPDAPILGSLQYAAPELLQSDVPIIQTPIDIWALGVSIYAMIAGSLPFQHSMPAMLRDMIIKGEYEAEILKVKLEGNHAGHEALVELLEGCINMDVDQRWDIGRVLESRWLEGFGEESTSVESP